MAQTVAAFVLGDQQMTADCVARIRSQFVGDDGECMSAASSEEARRLMSMPPFFGNRFVTMDAESFDEPLRDFLEAAFKAISPSCMLVVTGKSVSSKLWGPLGKIGDPVFRRLYFESPRDDDATMKFIRLKAEKEGLRIAPGAVRLLADTCGNDTSMLASELGKLSVFGPEITEDMVRTHAAGDLSGEFFRLYRALADGDAGSCLLEARGLAAGTGPEAVEQAVCKLLCVALRSTEKDSYQGEASQSSFNSKWWPAGEKKTDPSPTWFMSQQAGKVLARLGVERIRSLMCGCAGAAYVPGRPRSMAERCGEVETLIVAVCGHAS